MSYEPLRLDSKAMSDPSGDQMGVWDLGVGPSMAQFYRLCKPLPEEAISGERFFGVHTDLKTGVPREVGNNECVWAYVGEGGRFAVRIR